VPSGPCDQIACDPSNFALRQKTHEYSVDDDVGDEDRSGLASFGGFVTSAMMGRAHEIPLA
jgi:hypothetical protein